MEKWERKRKRGDFTSSIAFSGSTSIQGLKYGQNFIRRTLLKEIIEERLILHNFLNVKSENLKKLSTVINTSMSFYFEILSVFHNISVYIIPMNYTLDKKLI